ncbi:MAG: type II toxin-antitoxin system prevent-host-death family antitoxin [Firmicutes bacterium]|nr:type II toxin-antitoxin system prevent-host-death family antitoxin [Bacillota bacterium]
MPTITITEKELQTKFVKALESKKPAKVKIAEYEGVFMPIEEYYSLIETLAVKSVPGLWDKIVEGINTPIEECVDFDD